MFYILFYCPYMNSRKECKTFKSYKTYELSDAINQGIKCYIIMKGYRFKNSFSFFLSLVTYR